MSSLFVDTSGWGCYIDRRQPQHAQTLAQYQRAVARHSKLVTTNYVLAELVALLTSPLRLPRQQIISFIDALKSTSYVEVVHIDETLDAAAWALLKARPDKNWSLVDATSFVVMTRDTITEALTTDHHFEQAGFVRLLKPPAGA